jgi:DNA-binding response OmpR family regulator
MAKSSTLLFVSGNPELQQVLETLKSAYGFSLLIAENPKEGLNFIKMTDPDCIIFDLQLLRTHNHVERIKEKIKPTGIPVLYLNDGGNGVSRSDELRSSASVEPMVKFVAEQSERFKGSSSRRGWFRFLKRSKTGQA